MIIACPECVGPFELRDDDIAALVQIECPHCRFRMILDFAAANDSSLVETGMRMASGYRTAAEYRGASTGAPTVHVAEAAEADTPEIEIVPDVAAARTAPTAVPIAPPATQQPIAASTAATTAHTPPSGFTPSAPAPEEEDEASETIVRTPSGPIDQRGGGRSTVIGMPPQAVRTPVAARGTADAETEPARQRSDVLAAAGVTEGETAVRATPQPPTAARTEAPSARSEAPRAPATSRPQAEPRPRPVTPESRVPPAAREEAEPDERRSSALGAVFLVLLLILAAGLTIASVLRKNTPDPRPLLEDLYRQYIKP